MTNRSYATETDAAGLENLTGVSLYASYGLGDLGCRAAGIHHLVMAEMMERRCDHLRRNYADALVIEGDLWKTADRVIEATGERLGGSELFLLSATPPCQGMSTNGAGRITNAIRAGKRPAIDPRNRLVLAALHVIKRLRPRWVLFENVPQMANTMIEYEGLPVRILDIIASEIGPEYAGKAEVVDFSGYGVPQRRKRLITIYTRDAGGKKLLAEKGSLLPSPTHQQPITLRQAIGEYEILDARTQRYSASDPLHRVKKIGHQYEAIRHTPEGRRAHDNQCAKCGCRDNPTFNGKQESHFPTRCIACGAFLPRPMTMKHGEWRSTCGFKTSYKRMRWDAPAPTITQNLMCPSSDTKLHPDPHRTLSPAEALALQTVSRYAYDWGESPTDRVLCEAAGEAVPPLFLEQAARHIIAVSAAGHATRPAISNRRTHHRDPIENQRSPSMQSRTVPHRPRRDDDATPDRPTQGKTDPRRTSMRRDAPFERCAPV